MADLSGKLNDYMLLAVEEAKTSLREGNCGFGAIIINTGQVIANIDLPCREVFERAGKPVTIYDGVLKERCSVLYDRRVREEVELLRGADEAKLAELAHELTQKRLGWLRENREALGIVGQHPLEAAYCVFTRKLGIAPEDAPVIRRDPDRITIASRNFCPTLEACDILGLDTRNICKCFTEEPMAALLRQVHPGLRFSRNYETLRPHGECCEEIISLTSA